VEIPLAVIQKDKPWHSPRRSVEQVDSADLAATLARIEGLARVMDALVTIPGTSIRMGLDGMVGLVPVVGDVIGKAISSYIIWEARRIGVSRLTLARMLGNSLVDMTFGAVPVVGDIFDVAFKANLRNLALLKADLERKGVVPRTIEHR
jgi:hypothetical protein